MGNGTTYEWDPEGTAGFYHEDEGYGIVDSSRTGGDVLFHVFDVGGVDLHVFHVLNVHGSELYAGQAVGIDVEVTDAAPPETRGVRIRPRDTLRIEIEPEVRPRATGTDRSPTNDTQVFDPSVGDTQVFEAGVDTPDTSRSGPSYCPYCGADLTGYDGAAFCSACGEELS